MANVLIVGATSAIAVETAVRLAARGDRLYLMGRNRAKMDDLRARLGSAVVGFEIADLDEVNDNAQRVERAIASLGDLDVAIIAHGLLGDQLASEASYAVAETILRTNLLSPISLLIPLANYFESRGRGDIAVLSSVAGVRGRPRNYTYGAAKGALTVYLQGIRTRLYPHGVGVHTFKLGPVDTPMTHDHAKNRLFAQPGPVATSLIKAIDGKRGEVFVPWYWAPIMGIVRRMPEPVIRRFAFLSGR